MKLTPLIERAIKKAALLHKTQERKGGGYPYVTHLFSVAVLLSEYTDDEEIIASGLLHDTIEDTEYAEAELRSEFGDRIADIVMGITEPSSPTGEKLSWEERKHGYSEKLASAPIESLMVASADKIHNFTSIVERYTAEPDLYKVEFNNKSGEERTRHYGAIVEAITSRLEGPLAERLKQAWEQYRTFLQTI